jgi:uncharacterized protein YbaR (Trm112 family)
MQRNPEVCPYCKSKNLIPEEKFAEVEKIKGTSVNVKMAKMSSIKMDCPYCGAPQPIDSKKKELICKRCHKHYAIPEKIRDLL